MTFWLDGWSMRKMAVPIYQSAFQLWLSKVQYLPSVPDNVGSSWGSPFVAPPAWAPRIPGVPRKCPTVESVSSAARRPPSSSWPFGPTSCGPGPSESANIPSSRCRPHEVQTAPSRICSREKQVYAAHIINTLLQGSALHPNQCSQGHLVQHTLTMATIG